MEIGPLKEGYKVEVNQPKNSILPPLQIRSIVLGPGSSGKSNFLVTLLTDHRFYRGLFSKIYWCSPTAKIDPSLDSLKKYCEDVLDQDQDEDPTFHEQIDVPFLQSRVWRNKKNNSIFETNQITKRLFYMYCY